MHDDRRSGAATCCLPSPQREKSCEKALPKDTTNGKDLALGPGWTASHPHDSPPFTSWQGSRPRAWLSQSPLCSSPCSLLIPQHGGSASPVPSPSTFAAEVLLHSREADLLVQQLLLLAVLTLRHHPVQPLKVLTAVLAAELIHLVLPKRPPPRQPGCQEVPGLLREARARLWG